jgi:hypothetical protein
MALAGLSTDCLLAHSRHRRKENLERYLDWGKLLLCSARERFGIKPGMMQAFTLVRKEGNTALSAVVANLSRELDVEDFEQAEVGGRISSTTVGHTAQQ